MTNQKCNILGPILLLTLLISFNAVASSIKRADGDDIKFLLSAASGVNSAYWATFIGETHDRVYIEYETEIHSSSFFAKDLKHVVYWLPTSEISKEDLDKFKEFKTRYQMKKSKEKKPLI